MRRPGGLQPLGHSHWHAHGGADCHRQRRRQPADRSHVWFGHRLGHGSHRHAGTAVPGARCHRRAEHKQPGQCHAHQPLHRHAHSGHGAHLCRRQRGRLLHRPRILFCRAGFPFTGGRGPGTSCFIAVQFSATLQTRRSAHRNPHPDHQSCRRGASGDCAVRRRRHQ